MLSLLRATAILVALSAAGCTTSSGDVGLADLTQQNAGQFIVRGQTREADLIKRFGQPSTVGSSPIGRSLIWNANSTAIHAAAFIPVYGQFSGNSFSAEVKTLQVNLDGNGIVRDYSLSVNRQSR